MNLRQLDYFLTVADEGSFTRAAERLFVAQPSLSQQIKALEQEMGGLLLERMPKGVRLTAAGRAFLPEARAAVTHAASASRNARSVLGLEAGELEVATVTSIAFGVLPSAFKILHERHPATTIALREYTHRGALEDAARTGVGDIAVGPRPTQWHGPVIDLGWEEFVLVLPTTNPLADARGPVALEDLADHNWVLFGPDHGLSALILEACAAAGFTPRTTVQTAQVAAASHLAAAGLGVTIIPGNVVPQGLDATILTLDPPLMRQLVAYTRQDWSPHAAAFVHALQELPWPPFPGTATVVA